MIFIILLKIEKGGIILSNPDLSPHDGIQDQNQTVPSNGEVAPPRTLTVSGTRASGVYQENVGDLPRRITSENLPVLALLASESEPSTSLLHS